MIKAYIQRIVIFEIQPNCLEIPKYKFKGTTKSCVNSVVALLPILYDEKCYLQQKP
jgi:hypothetical protein